MLEAMYPGQSRVYISDSIGKRLAPLKEYGNTCGYGILTDDAARFIKEIEAQLKERYDALAAGDDTVLAAAPLLLLIIDNYDAAAAVCSDREAMEAYKNVTGRYKNLNVCIIVSALENAASVAAMVLTTESLVADLPEPPAPAAPAGADMGGMY